MFISKPRKNKDGSISYTFRCSIKTANGFQSRVKTVRLPSDIDKKDINLWKEEQAIAWKKELKQSGIKSTSPKNNILFIDLARQYNEELFLHNPTGYAHYNSNLAHIKTIEPKLGKYKVTEITPLILNDFYNYLLARRYEKVKIVAKPALSSLIDEKHIALRTIAEGCKIAHTTLFAALHGEHINENTATKICNYLKISLNEYFTVEKESHLYSYSANNGVKVFIHGVLQYAVRLGLTDRNCASDLGFTIPKTESKKEILESLDECKYFIECMNTETDLRKKTAFALYIFLGLRNAEVCGLTWKNIDFENSTISIVQNTIYAGKRFGTITKEPKTKTSKRTIGMPTALVDILKEYKVWWEAEKLRLGDIWGNSDKLFMSNTGKETSGGTLAQWLKDFEIKHGIKAVSPHGMRHTSVTLLISNGVDVRTTASRYGHSNVQTTLSIYSHYTKEADRQAAETIDRLLKL